MNAQIQAQALTIQYPHREEPALKGFDLAIEPGEFVVIAGPSGSGKSTFSRTLIGLIPHLTKGDIVDGVLTVNDVNTMESEVHALAQNVGIVFQDPETNIFSLVVLDELALGPENMGCSYEEIIQRVSDASDWVGVRDLWTARTDRLSGGQKQRVAIAGVLAMMPNILVLDEPTTDLDPVGKRQVITTLRRLKETLGLTIVVIEHDLSHLMDVADRLVIVGEAGRVLLEGSPAQVLAEGYEEINRVGLRVPTFARLAHVLKEHGCVPESFPLNAEQGLELASRHGEKMPAVVESLGCEAPAPVREQGAPLLTVEDLHFSYVKQEPVLNGLAFEVTQSEFVAIVGPNGSGKSSLLKTLVGLNQPDRGRIRLWNRQGQRVEKGAVTDHVSYVFQDPDHQLFENTVWDEVAFTLRLREEPAALIEERVTEILQKVKLYQLKDRHPATLSRGEKRRLAVATALSYPIDLLLLDEPTTGQDLHTLDGLFGILEDLNREDGTAILFVTHDMCTVWKYTSRVIGIHQGRIVYDGPTGDLLDPKNAALLAQLELDVPLEAALAAFYGRHSAPDQADAGEGHLDLEALTTSNLTNIV